MPSPSRFENRQWQGFRLGSGPGLAGDSKPGRKKKGGGGEGGAPSRLVNGSVNWLSVGGLLGASCQKQGEGEGVLY